MEYRLSLPLLVIGSLGFSLSVLVVACVLESIKSLIRRRGRRPERGRRVREAHRASWQETVVWRRPVEDNLLKAGDSCRSIVS
jgi:hypothetical protein